MWQLLNACTSLRTQRNVDTNLYIMFYIDMIRLPILNERQFFDSPMVVGDVPSMPPIALASRELSRRGTFKVSLLRKAAL